MEAQLQELISKIQDEGVREAERQAAALIHEAEAKAAGIVQQARKEAEKRLTEAEKSKALLEARGREALQQAGRDLILTLRASIMKLFDSLLKAEIKTTLEGNLLEEIVIRVLEGWTAKGTGETELLVSAKDAERVAKVIRARLSKEAAKGIEIKPVPAVEAGFRIGAKDGSAYYNVTDEGIAEILSVFVNPLIAEQLKTASGEKKA